MKKYNHYTHFLTNKFTYIFLIALLIVCILIIVSLPHAVPENNVKEQTFSWLNKIKQVKKNEVIDYFLEIKDKALNVNQDKTILHAFETMKKGKYNSDLELEIDKHYVKKYSNFYDILFVSNNGYIFHSIKKESDYQQNLFTQNNASTKLSSYLKKTENEKFVDFEYYPPSDEAAAFFIVALKNEQQHIGWIILQVATNRINKILIERQELGRTGEVYLVNQKHLMLTDSRFIEDSTILRQKVDTKAVENAFRFSNGEKIISDYRGINVFSSFESFELMGIKWVILVEVDEDEIISDFYKKHKQYFQREIVQYLAIQKSEKSTTLKIDRSLKRVDMNEFYKAEKTRGLMTVGVSTCTSIAIIHQDMFSYLAHITPTDEIYINSSLIKFFLGDHYQNVFSQLLEKIIYYDIHAYELKQLQIVIAAPHDNSFAKAIDVLLENHIELSQIKLMYIPKARSIRVALKEAGKILDVTWIEEGKTVGKTMFEVEDLGTIVKNIIHYDKKVT